MISLKEIYGNQLFDRKASYSNAQYIPYVADFLLDIVLTLAIISVFDVHWEYAFLKVFGLIYLFAILKYIFSYLMNVLNYRLIVKNALSFEMKHYLNVLSDNFNWDEEVATYDEFLLESAFNKTLPVNLRLLAAINYGIIVGWMSFDPHYDGRSYTLFCEIVPDFIPKDFKTKYQTID